MKQALILSSVFALAAGCQCGTIQQNLAQGRAANEACEAGAQCASGACRDGKCEEGERSGEKCTAGTQCASTRCESGVCAEGSQPSGTSCEKAGTCASGLCVKGACQSGQSPTGAECLRDAECSSGRCESAKCAPSSCKKIDLVFSVDNSSSMSEESKAMRDVVFPAFAAALRRMPLDDFRVGVLDACPKPAAFHTKGRSGACNFEGGNVWMTSRSSRLVEEFTCVGYIDSSGAQCTGNNDDEQPASTSAAALEPPASTGPNVGFSRDDAVLVVVAITDEDEQPTPQKTAAEVYQRLIAVKGGSAKRMVFLGIGGQKTCTGVYGSAKDAVKLKELSALFSAQQRGLFWDLCVGRLEDGLVNAVQLIEKACDEFPETGPGGAPCTSPGQCASGKCTQGICEGGPGNLPPGSPCTRYDECSSGICRDNTCSPGIN